MSINQRIAELEKLYKSKGIKAFYKRAGIPQGTFMSIKTEGRDIRVSNLIKILEYDKSISPNWLLMGEGEMWRKDTEQDKDLREEVELIKEKLEVITKRLEKSS